MGLVNIEEKSIGYNLIKTWVKFWHNKIYYRSFTVLGKENIPFDKPLIFTPNHQNALMDALALGLSVKKQFVFVARSDIFKKPIIAKILYFLKILPIYRVRDGFETVKKNKDIIHKTIDIITSGSAMVILPEGNHSGFRRLRPLKKGFARMAFQTEEANNYKLDIQIVPVGIDYDNYQNYRSSPIVNFGIPIPVKEYTELYKENPAIAINSIKQRLSEHLKPTIVDIESEDNYDLYNELRVIYRSHMAKKLDLDSEDNKNRLFIDQELISSLSKYETQHPNEISDYQNNILRFIKLRNNLGITNSIIEQKGIKLPSMLINSIVLLLTFPIFMYGVINNFLPYWIPIKFSKKIKDPQFQSSFKFVISLLSFPVFYILQSVMVLLITKNWNMGLGYLLMLPITASFAWWWQQVFNTVWVGWRYRIIRSKKNRGFIEMQHLYDKIISWTSGIV